MKKLIIQNLLNLIGMIITSLIEFILILITVCGFFIISGDVINQLYIKKIKVLMNFFYIIPFYIRHIFSYASYTLLTFYMPYLNKSTESLFVEPTFRSIEKFLNFLFSCLKLMGFIRFLICIFKLLLKI